VIDSTPTPNEAKAALAEAGTKAAQVRRADRTFSRMLLVIVGLYIAVGAVMSIAGRRGGPIAAFSLLAIAVTALIAVVWLGLRLRAYSRAGILWYVWAIAAFSIWNGIVVGMSLVTRFWSSTQPSYHFGLSVLVAVVPLVVAAYLIGRR
jgi:hypothetical protein